MALKELKKEIIQMMNKIINSGMFVILFGIILLGKTIFFYNNTIAISEELEYETVKLEVTLGNNPYRGEDIPISVAKRDAVSDIVVV